MYFNFINELIFVHSNRACVILCRVLVVQINAKTILFNFSAYFSNHSFLFQEMNN